MAGPWEAYAAQKGPWTEYQKQGPGALAAGAEGLAQGISFGFADELEGGARALYNKVTGDPRSFGELYDEGVKAPRARIAAAREGNPVAFTVGELGGGLAVPGGLARAGIRGAVSATAGRGLGTRTAAGAAEGAAYGAAYGAGTAEGGLPERLTGAAGGAATGALIGAAVPGAVDAAGAIGTRLAAPFRAAMAPRQFAGEKVGEAIQRDYATGRPGTPLDVFVPPPAPVTPPSPTNAAMRFSTEVLDQSRANPEAVLMDAGGENVRNLMRSAANMPNQSRETVRRAMDDRQARQYQRIEGNLSRDMGTNKNLYDSIDDLADQFSKIGAQKIAPTLAKDPPITPELTRLLENPTMKNIVDRVRIKMDLEDVPQAAGYNMRMLHRIKVELDDAIGDAKQAAKMGTERSAGMDYRTLVMAKDRLMKNIDNPEYKTALKEAAEVGSLKTAAKQGIDDFASMAPEELRSTLKAFKTDAERDFYRIGIMRAVVDKIRGPNVNNDRVGAIFQSPQMQEKLRAVMPSPQAYKAFVDDLKIEASMAASRRALQGNSTTAKQLTEGAEAGKTAGFVASIANAASGGFTPVMNALSQGYNRFSGLSPRVAQEMLDLGMSRNAGQVNALVRRGMDRAAMIPDARAARSDMTIGGLTAAGNQPSGYDPDLGLYGVVRP